jgi:hypothetical protein
VAFFTGAFFVAFLAFGAGALVAAGLAVVVASMASVVAVVVFLMGKSSLHWLKPARSAGFFLLGSCSLCWRVKPSF